MGRERAVVSLNAVTFDRVDLPQGTLNLLILKTVARAPQHGLAISEWIYRIVEPAVGSDRGSMG
jgi:PadR family transcriptional regulator PadR